MHRYRTIFTVLLLVFVTHTLYSKSIKDVHGFEPQFVLPDKSNLINIKSFGAVGDGKTDDTQAFKLAFEENQPRGIYIPAGTYLISDSIIYGRKSNKKKRVCLIGESVSRSILKLADHSPGFGNPDKPKVFIHTRPPGQQGEQNMHQYIYHLTIEIGRGNPGAVALNYHSNNTGVIKDVVIRTSDPQQSPAHTGLACSDWEVGPASAYYLTVEGFQTGIALTRVGNYFTMEHITVKNCNTAVTCHNTVSIRALHTQKCELPVKSMGMTVLLDSVFQGKGNVAVLNEKGGLLARGISIRGYTHSIVSGDTTVSKHDINEFTSEPPKSNWPVSTLRTLNLPVQISPEIPYPMQSSDWIVMDQSGDITRTLQTAIDDGAKTIYIPGGGGQKITDTIILRHRLQRIMGAGVATIKMDTPNAPVFRLAQGESPIVILELLYANYGSKHDVGVEQATPRTLVLRHSSLSYRTAPAGQGGKVFSESVVSWAQFQGVQAWLRDIDTEAGGLHAKNIFNNASTLWIMGHKTEDFATKIKTINGGSTELLGGTFRQNWDLNDFQRAGIDPDNPPPLFESHNSNISLTYVSWGPAQPYRTLVREIRKDEIRDLRRQTYGGSSVLFVGRTDR